MPGQQTLAQMVRAKYPGAYDDLTDQQLESQVRAKFPGTYDDLPTTQVKTETPPVPQPSMWQRAAQSATQALTGIAPEQQGRAADVLAGAGKSVLGTIEGGGKLIRSIPGVGPALAGMGDVTLPVTSQPTNADQATGKTLGNIAQMFVPGTALGKVKAAWATGNGMLDALIGAGVEGASAGTIGAAQTGSVKEGAKIGATAAGTGLAVQGALAAAKPLAEKIENVLVKPSKADLADGFDPENIFKYKVGGTLSQSYDKVQTKIKNLSNQLKTTLANAPAGSEIDLNDAMAETMKRLHANAAGTYGQNAAIESAAEKLAEEIPTVTKTGKVDLATANQVKQGVGDIGSWAFGGITDELKAKEIVANALYDTLKTRIESAVSNAPGRVQQINSQLSDLIPIKNAITRRIPVAQRNAVLNLGNLLGMSSGHYWVGALNSLLQSGPAANVINAAGESAPSLAAGAGRIAGGGVR